MLFYGLPRFSVDLDFDLLDYKKKQIVLNRLNDLLPEFGQLVEATEKKYTLFFLLRYEKGERNIKIEISKRGAMAEFVKKNYLGISMLVMTRADITAGKLAALLTRKRFASRDVFDLWFFLKNNWPLNENFLKEKTGLSLAKAFKKAETLLIKIKKTELLSGLGELIDNKQKNWVREKLVKDLMFYLRLYKEQLSS